MSRALTRILAVAAAALVAAIAGSARAQPGCVTCHRGRVEAALRRPTELLPDDAHGRVGIECVDCHLGDAEADGAEAHDLAGGFVGRPAGAAAARMCGRCHDGTTDAPDTLDAWRAGRHARALAEGRAGVATCASCHGGHGIGRDEAARARVVGTCAACHSDPARMEGTGLPTDQARQWARSVHGARVAEGSTEAPVCASCHDPHENAAGLAAASACGTCHEAVRAAFDRGPHRAHFEPLGFLDCVECHGSHEIQPPAAAMLAGLDAVCRRCHGQSQPLFLEVARMAALGHAVDRVRALEAPDDRRRGAVIAAIHALDADGLEAALAGVPTTPIPALRPPPPPPSSRPPAVGLALTVAAALLALAAFALLAAWRRR